MDDAASVASEEGLGLWDAVSVGAVEYREGSAQDDQGGASAYHCPSCGAWEMGDQVDGQLAGTLSELVQFGRPPPRSFHSASPDERLVFSVAGGSRQLRRGWARSLALMQRQGVPSARESTGAGV